MNGGAASLNSFWEQIKRGDSTAAIARYSDLLLPLGLLFIIATLFIQIHPEILSILILLNLAMSVTVLVTSLYINSPLQLTSYPTVLLLTTIFRLTLSVSAARNILTIGDGGSVIEALGKITAGGFVVVGAVMFIMILVVQYIVVAKGAERVSEVAARFTLDAMPGKQMAIDADLRSSAITQEQARAMRGELQKESQLYGAMDGAMKFVKNDAVATVIIAAVNISAGLLIGIGYKGMAWEQAAQKYTILTFGDGLAAVISSMLVTVSAGIVVTRVASSGDEQTTVGADIGNQLFTNPKPLFVTSGLLILMTPLGLLFGGVGLALGGAAFFLKRRQKILALESAAVAAARALTTGERSDEDFQPTFTVPLAIGVSRELAHLVDKQTAAGAQFRADLTRLRAALYYDLGVMLPFCQVTENASLKPNQYFIALKEVPVGFGFIRPDSVFVNDTAENIRVFGLAGETVVNPATLKPGAWIPASERRIAEGAGLKIWEPADFILLHLSHAMQKYAHEFVGIQETQGYLDFAARNAPKLVEEVTKTVALPKITDVLQRLVQEGISIRDIKTILDALSEAGRTEQDAVMLTEQVRSSLRRYISYRYTRGKDTLFVYLLDPEIEDVIRGAIRRTSTGAFLSLDPAITHDILGALRRAVANLPPTAQQPVIVTDLELRRFVKKMVELEFPALAVVSFQELTPELNIQPVGRITMRAVAAASIANPNLTRLETDLAEFSLMEG
jgi:type III secretion protein V